MNRSGISQGEILQVSRNMILESGISTFSMRTVAGKCGVALGSIYNYFPSKADLISATIESVWKEIFKPFDEISRLHNFIDCVVVLFDTIKNGNEKYPGFFTVHSLNFAAGDKAKGKEMMGKYFDTLEHKLLDALENDDHVRENLFQNGLTKKTFVNYVWTLLVSILIKGDTDCNPLVEMIKNCIY